MDNVKKSKILKSFCIAGASLCAAGMVTGFTIGCVGSHCHMKSVELAQENGYDVANANCKAEKLNIYTEMYNQGLMSEDEFRRSISDVQGLNYDTFISESSLPEEVKAEYSSLREKQDKYQPAFAGVAGVIPFAFLVAGAVVNDEDYKKAKYERKQEKPSKIFVDNNIQL